LLRLHWSCVAAVDRGACKGSSTEYCRELTCQHAELAGLSALSCDHSRHRLLRCKSSIGGALGLPKLLRYIAQAGSESGRRKRARRPNAPSSTA